MATTEGPNVVVSTDSDITIRAIPTISPKGKILLNEHIPDNEMYHLVQTDQYVCGKAVFEAMKTAIQNK